MPVGRTSAQAATNPDNTPAQQSILAAGFQQTLGQIGTIVGNGTSADTQLAVFEQAQTGSAGKDGALRAVTDWIAEATLQ